MTETQLPYKLVKGALTPSQCSAYIKWIDKYATKDQFRKGYSLLGMPTENLFDENINFLQPLRVVLRKVETFFRSNYEMQYEFGMKRFYGNIMDTGAENPAHDDDGDYYDGKPDVELHYSCILMLNSDYEGGELYFQHHGVEVKLEAGDLIMFRGNAENLHGVRPIKEGKRYNFIFFYRDYIPTEETIANS
tara:strand:+ start:1008 stop:1580 length:573 start_codon:yes stop_codon:yes gene_type:complete